MGLDQKFYENPPGVMNMNSQGPGHLWHIIDGSLIIDQNLTVTQNFTIAGTVSFNGQVVITPSMTAASAASMVWNGVSIPTATLTVTGTTHVTTSAGVNLFAIAAPVITDASAVTIDQAATFYIAGPPSAGGSVTITNPAAFVVAAGNVGIRTNMPLATVHVGNGTSIGGSVDVQVLVSRAADNTVSGNGHAFSDASVVNRTGTIGYNSFDAEASHTGVAGYDHYAAFQYGGNYGSAGTIARIYGMYSHPTISAGTVTALYHFNASTYVAGGGSVTTQYGFYCDTLAGASTSYAFYSNGTNPSQLGGALKITGNLTVGNGNATYPITLQHATAPVMEFDRGATVIGFILNSGTGFAGQSATDFAIMGNGSSQLQLGNGGVLAVTINAGAMAVVGVVTSAQGTATTANGAQVLKLGASGPNVYAGSGAPTGLSAVQGSLYLRTDGTTTNDRAYINSNGSTTWTALTTVA